MSKNKILRDDILGKGVLDIGKDISISLNPAIKKYNDFNKSINELKKSILSLSKLSTEFKGVSTSNKFTEKISIQNKILDKSKVAYKNVIKQKNDLIKTEIRLAHVKSSANQALIKERLQLQINNKIIKQAKLEELGLVGAYQKLNKLRTDAKVRLSNLLSVEKQNTKEVSRATKEYEKLNKRVLKVDRATNNYSKNVGNYKSALGGAISTTRQFASALGLVGGAFAFVSIFRNAFNSIKSFDDSMQNLAGISRVTREEMADLEQVIIDVSGESVRTATDVAKLAESLTTLGKSKEEVKQLLKPVNDLSLALGSASDETGEFLVQMLNTFGASTSEALKYADTIATIRTTTSLNFQKMRDSFQYLAPISKVLNKDLAYTGALVGILADNGIKAERAGRLLGTAQQKLAKDGLTLNDGLEKINEASSRGVTEIKLLEIANKLFGTQASGLGIILANNSLEIDKNADAIRNNSGALEDLVNQQLLSLSAHLDILKSKWESYILNTDKSTGVTNSLKDGIKFLSNNLETIVSSLITVIKYIGLYKLGVILSNSAMKAGGILNTLYTLSLTKMRGGLSATIKSLKALKIATASSGVGLILVLLGSAYALWSSFADGASKAEKELKKFNDSLDRTKEKTNEAIKNLETYTKGFSRVNAATIGLEDSLDNLDKAYEKEGFAMGINEELRKFITKTRVLDIKTIQKQVEAGNNVSDELKKRTLNTILYIRALQDQVSINKEFIQQEKEKKKEEQKNARNSLNEEQKNKKEEEQKKLKKDIFNLNKFRLQTEINLQKELFNNQSESSLERLIALEQIQIKEIELAVLTKDRKLENVKKGTKEETLILEKFEQTKKDITKKFDTGFDVLELNAIKRNADEKARIKENALNKEIKDNNDLLKLALDNERIGLEERKTLIEQNEKEIAEIKKKYALEGLNSQLIALKQLIEATDVNSVLRAEYEQKAHDISININKLTTNDFLEKNNNIVENVKITSQEILQISQELVGALTDLSNSLFDARIEKIDYQINKNNEFYDNEIELAGEDERKKKLIEEERYQRNKKLEKEKRKQQRKQAIFEKLTTIAQIKLATALAIINALQTKPFPVALVSSITAGVLGAIQLATAISTPIPSYFKGTENHIGGLAEVAEIRPEVIIEPNKKPYIVKQRSILDLPKHTKVVPSLEEYESLFNPSLMDSISLNKSNIDNYNYNSINNKLIIDLMKENNNLLKLKKPLYIKNINNNLEIAKSLDFLNYKRQEDF